MPIEKAYADAAAAGRVLNYGFSASWAAARGLVLSGVEPSADFHASLALLGDLDWQRSSSSAELDAWLGLLERGARRGRARDRRADGLRAAVRPGGVPRGRRARGIGRRRHLHARARTHRDRPRDPDRRCSRGRARGGRDRRSDAPLPCEQHLQAPHRPRAGHDRRRARRRVAGLGRGLPLWHGQHRRRRVLPRARAARGGGAEALQHRDARHGGADRGRAAPARDPRDGSGGDVLRGVPRRPGRTRPRAAATCTGVSRLDRRERRHARRVARPPGRHQGMAAAARSVVAPPHLRHLRQEPAADGARARAVGLGRGVPPMLVPAGAGPR